MRVAGWIFMRSPQRGAQTTIHCAVSKNIAESTGMYFANCEVQKLRNPQALDDKVVEQLWQVSARLVGLDNKKS